MKEIRFLILLLLSQIQAFTCLDGSGNGAVAVLNDDYCDCNDSSDEPETSACSPNGRFTCKWNQEFYNELNDFIQKTPNSFTLDDGAFLSALNALPKTISSQWVHDGICDCCDGSDEIINYCPNTCKSAENRLKMVMRDAYLTLTRGLQARDTLLKQAVIKMDNDAKSLVEKKKKLIAEESKLQLYQDHLRKAEKREEIENEKKEVEREKTCPEISLLKYERESAQRVRTELEEANSKFWSLESKHQTLEKEYKELFEIVKGYLSPEQLSLYDKTPKEEQPQTNQDQSESQESFAPPVSTDDDSINSETTAPSAEESTESTESNDSSEVSQDTCPATLKVMGICVHPSLLSWSQKLGLVESATSLRSRISRLTTDVSLLKSEILGLEESKNFGPDNVWATLDKKCFKVDVLEYTYEVCLFGQAKQMKIGDTGASSSVSLGHFTRFGARNGDESVITSMLFENGQGCWNGPSRSVQVDFECGDETKLLTVDEPSKCEYFVKASSPVACLSHPSVPSPSPHTEKQHQEL